MTSLAPCIEPESFGLSRRNIGGPAPVIPLLPVQPRWPFGKLPPVEPHEMEFDAGSGYAGVVRNPSPAPATPEDVARALRIELNAALCREGELATDNARLRGERDELARELSRRAMARA